MTYIEAYRLGVKILSENNIENANFDNRLIFENIFNLDRSKLAINSNGIASEDKLQKYLKDIKLRASGEPLQYILGTWEFMSLEFKVGKGVLIPREETEIIVNSVIDECKKEDKKRIIFDLCSGSGCIGISIAKFVPNSSVYLIEKSDNALEYLKQNVKMSGLNNINVIKGDITNDFNDYNLPKPDIIVSNPPYIKSQDIKTLQSEVKLEPKMALDGGEDGLDFYRVIAKNWSSVIKEDGLVILEIGDKQDKDVEDIFNNRLKFVKKVKDFNDIYRTLVFKR